MRGFGNRKSVSIARKAAVSHDYKAKNGNLLKSTYANGWEVAYTYDNLDRVTKVKASKDGTSYTIGRYIYDKLGRVARFVDGQVSGKSCTYGYDLTDRLCEAVFDDGTAYRYTYDANGNLLSDGKYTYSWTKGSLLEKVTGDGLEAVYTSDASGIRTSKKVNGITTEYLTAGGSVLSEKKNGVWQHYLYDGSGQLMAIRYKGADYYYIRDGLMTITGLVDANGVAVVNYRYDSWGTVTGTTGSMAASLGKDNPYRFKGYYYDEETGMYYLKSRYYQPEICRFISADEEDVLTSTYVGFTNKNLYLYCDNNSLEKVDECGDIAEWVVGAAIGATINVVTSLISAQATGQEFGMKDAIIAATFGALSGVAKYSPCAILLNGVYTAYTSYKGGATIEASLFNGCISAGFSAISIGNLSKLNTFSNGEIQVGETIATSVIDLAVGTGNACMSSGITTAVTLSYSRNRTNHSSKKRNIRGREPRKIADKKVRRNGRTYRERRYIYHNRRFVRWDRLR